MSDRLLKQPIVSVLTNHAIDYPTPTNLSYWWEFGSAAGIFLGLQIVTGIFLAMHYTPHVDLAFNSVEHIMRDVNNGWLLRYVHANGASFFFFATAAGCFLQSSSLQQQRGVFFNLLLCRCSWSSVSTRRRRTGCMTRACCRVPGSEQVFCCFLSCE